MLTIDAYLRAKETGGRFVGKAASQGTLRSYRSALTQAELLLGKPLSAMTEDDGDRFMEILSEKGFTSQYSSLLLSALRGAFVWGIGKKLFLTAHPFDGIQSPSKARELPTIMTKKQLEKFFAALSGQPKYQLFFKIMYYGGLRIDEVTKLKRSDVKEEALLVNGKGSKQRMVYLPDSLRKELGKWMQHHYESDYVFYSQYQTIKPMTVSYARTVFQQAVKKASLPAELHPHNLRHASATHFYEATEDMALTQKMLGHANPATTMLYAQIANKQLHNGQKKAFGD